MPHAHFLQDLAAVMVAAATMTLLCRMLNQPVVIGYLLAGFLIGPYTPPISWVKDLSSIHTMAELGLIFLMFYLGLEFNLPKLRRVGLSALAAVVLEVVGMFAVGVLLAQLFGWSRIDGIFLGAILSISSTTIIVKVFADLNLAKEEFAQAVFGILILEDIVAILILSALSGLGDTGTLEFLPVAQSAAKILLFMTLFLILGLSIVPRFIGWIDRFRSKEMLGIVALGLCLLGAILASACGFSVALGGFLMGAVVAASPQLQDIEEWFAPVRDMFSAIFFVAAGMLIQPALVWQYKGAIAAVVAATLVGKIISGTLGSVFAGYRLKTAAKIGFSLGQIGEFSFVIASLAVSSKAASEFLYPLAVTVSSLTTFCTPFLIRRSDFFVEQGLRWVPAGLLRALDVYYEKIHATPSVKNVADKKSAESRIFSKYLIRLGIYAALLISVLLAASALSSRSSDYQFSWFLPLGFWALSAIAALPLLGLIAKYAAHMVLVLSTINRHSFVLRFFNIGIFYKTAYACVWLALAGALSLAALRSLPAVFMTGFLLAFLLSAQLIFQRWILKGAERTEALLDEVLGLATSEPTRRAVISLGGYNSLLREITRQVAVKETSLCARRTIRELRIRERTGASVVAIYRQAEQLANPSPDTQILPEDILILLGTDAQCGQAQTLVESSRL